MYNYSIQLQCVLVRAGIHVLSTLKRHALTLSAVCDFELDFAPPVVCFECDSYPVPVMVI